MEWHWWDMLRPVTEHAEALDIYTRYLVLIFSFIIFVIALKAYLKKKNQKLLLVLTAFTLFFVRGLLRVLDLYLSPGDFFSKASQNVFELLILLALVMAIFRK
ncbi:MAG: hypothetical protein AB1467_06205 [Candidatus Diapherotrites archaeon]